MYCDKKMWHTSPWWNLHCPRWSGRGPSASPSWSWTRRICPRWSAPSQRWAARWRRPTGGRWSCWWRVCHRDTPGVPGWSAPPCGQAVFRCRQSRALWPAGIPSPAIRKQRLDKKKDKTMCSITEENFDESRQTAGEKNWRKACYRNFLGKLVN